MGGTGGGASAAAAHAAACCAALAAGWLVGVALQLQQAALWPAAACALALLPPLLAWPWRRHALVLGAAGAVLGFAATALQAHARLAGTLDPALEGVDLVVEGVVDALPQHGADGTRFVLSPRTAALAGGEAVNLPPRLSLGWFRAGFGDDALDTLAGGPRHALRAGEAWRFVLRLKAPHGSLNPHGADFELRLFQQGIGATGSVRRGERLAPAAGAPVQRLRQWARDAIEARVPEARAAGVLAALAVGDQAAIERADWDVFRAAGVAHLMSISGLHVTMFAWLAAACVGAAWRRSARLVHALPAPPAARWAGVLLAAAYAQVAGGGVPSQRTVWMLATAATLASLGVRWPWPGVLLAAAVVVSAVDPWALLQPGCWLSFAAVGLLLASSPAAPAAPPPQLARERAAALARGALRTQALATLGLAPLTLVCFQQVSLVGFAANLLAIPLVTLVITPLALLGLAAPPLWSLAAAAVQALAAVLGALAAWPGAVWLAAVAPAWAQGAGLLGGLLAVLPLPWRLRLLAVPLALPLLAPPVARPAPGRFELLAADVGQGTAVLVRTHRHLLLYDTGPPYGRASDAGRRVLLPLLRARGERAIDTLVLSHRDMDHVAGAPVLLQHMAVHALRGSLEPGHALRAGPAPFTPCAAGQRWDWDGVAFEVLHPASPDAAATPGVKPNAVSCVLRVRDAAGRSALLAGDLEAAQEAALVRTHGDALASDVLLVPHHGSKTSSSPAFLDAVAPALAVVQAGYRNRFGHPAPAVVARYAARGIALVHSPACGAWTWDGEHGACERERRRRYWHHGGGAAAGGRAALQGSPGTVEVP